MSASPVVHVVVQQVPWENSTNLGVFLSYDAAVRLARTSLRKEPNYEYYVEVWRGAECGGSYEITEHDERVVMSISQGHERSSDVG